MSQINKSARQVLAPILSNKRVGQYHQIIVSVGDIAAQCKPGNHEWFCEELLQFLAFRQALLWEERWN
jgi:hypothetical protein